MWGTVGGGGCVVSGGLWWDDAGHVSLCGYNHPSLNYIRVYINLYFKTKHEEMKYKTNYFEYYTGCLLYKFMGRVLVNTSIIPPWCGLCALIQLLCSNDILGGA